MTLKQRQEWFQKVSALSEDTAMTPAQALALVKPRARLPHLDPRGILIETFVTGPRKKPLPSQPLNRPMGRPNSPEVAYVKSPTPSYGSSPKKSTQSTGLAAAELAQKATTLEALKAAMESFDACALKAMATQMVFSDGNPQSKIMLVGEAPGAEEDLQGKPFVGLSGQLLDRMMAAIGLDRTKIYITNMIGWRPPGNRQPSTQELAMCLPFVHRHIELVAPKVLILVGGVASKTLLGRSDGIMRLRGQWHDFIVPGLPDPIATTAIFHPAYLLRSPGQKREAWWDLQMIQQKIQSVGM